MNFNPGDKAVLFGAITLRRIGLGSHIGKTVVLKRKMARSEIDQRSNLNGVYEAWWVTLNDGLTFNEYYVPVCCLALTDDVDPYLDYDTQQRKPENKKETYMLIAVTILKTPSVKAQEAGETETIVAPSTEVVAHDNNAAIALVAAANAEKITALKEEGAKLRVIVRQIG